MSREKQNKFGVSVALSFRVMNNITKANEVHRPKWFSNNAKNILVKKGVIYKRRKSCPCKIELLDFKHRERKIQ